jgi:outer membrane receptor protein involved in Fe transport
MQKLYSSPSYLLLIISCLLFTNLLGYAAPASSIRGKTVAFGTGTPVNFGQITLTDKGGSKEIATTSPNDNGEFILSGIEAGEYHLTIHALGFDIYTKKNIVMKNESVLELGIIELKSLEYGLEEVVVSAKKRQIVYKIDKKVIEAGNNMQASGGTAIDILENTPSMQINAEGEITFRGSSGFAVYVDGKPAMLSGSEALEQIPSALIENIEIITTPSARHDTGGDVGIINVITKKQAQNGLSGMVNLTGSTTLSHGVNFLLTKNINKISWRLGGTWDDKIRKSDFDQEKTTLVNGISTLSHSNGPRSGGFYNRILRAGWSYNQPKTTYDIDFEGGYFEKSRRGELDYIEERSEHGNLIEKGDYISYDDYYNWRKFIKGSIGFFHKFNDKGHTLSGNAYYQYDWRSLEYFQSDLFDKTPEHQRQQGHRAWEDEYHVKAQVNLDYINPYSETGKIEAGYRFYSYLEDGDYSMQFWSPERKEFYWRDDIYNTFYFQEGIHSLYAILNDRFKDFEFQAGVRAEHTHRALRSSKEWANRTFNRLEFFPSLHLGYNFKDNSVLLASYSRRTTRPDLFYMEPYITFRDYYSAEIGNPDVRPEYINSFEINYKKNISEQYTFSTTVFYRYRKDKIERLRIPYEAGITLDSMANVGHDYSLGFELFSQMQLTHWWTLNVNGSYYNYKVVNEYKLSGGRDGKSNNYEVAIGNMFDVLKNTRLQLDGYWVGPSVTTQGQTDAFRYLNLAVRQQLLKRKLSATLSVHDILRTAKYRSDIMTDNLQSITNIRPYYPLVTLTLNYTFNNYKAKQTNGKQDHDLFEGVNH